VVPGFGIVRKLFGGAAGEIERRVEILTLVA
jgi:hypothetical protein